MKGRSIILVASSFLFFSACAQHGPLSAEQIMHQAFQRAVKEKRNVMVIFHASWCGWCRKMDSSINDKNCRKFFDDNFVIAHLVVNESPDKKNLENPGVYEFRAKYHGENLGLPSWLIFDKDGSLLADSQIRPEGANIATEGENIGCPATPKEVAYFINVLKKTSHLDATEEAAIERRFLKNGE
ncbi:MAG TPA: thioredoxin family protein [Chitinophagaceae bacterium]|nr:thioredoxin family protein [Chitinophagaceae bacterium]